MFIPGKKREKIATRRLKEESRRRRKGIKKEISKESTNYLGGPGGKKNPNRGNGKCP